MALSHSDVDLGVSALAVVGCRASFSFSLSPRLLVFRHSEGNLVSALLETRWLFN